MNRDLTAYHEAGHAVMHVMTGIKFRYVTIRARRGPGRRVKSWPQDCHPWTNALIAEH